MTKCTKIVIPYFYLTSYSLKIYSNFLLCIRFVHAHLLDKFVLSSMTFSQPPFGECLSLIALLFKTVLMLSLCCCIAIVSITMHSHSQITFALSVSVSHLSCIYLLLLLFNYNTRTYDCLPILSEKSFFHTQSIEFLLFTSRCCCSLYAVAVIMFFFVWTSRGLIVISITTNSIVFPTFIGEGEGPF